MNTNYYACCPSRSIKVTNNSCPANYSPINRTPTPLTFTFKLQRFPFRFVCCFFVYFYSHYNVNYFRNTYKVFFLVNCPRFNC